MITREISLIRFKGYDPNNAYNESMLISALQQSSFALNITIDDTLDNWECIWNNGNNRIIFHHSNLNGYYIYLNSSTGTASIDTLETNYELKSQTYRIILFNSSNFAILYSDEIDIVNFAMRKEYDTTIINSVKFPNIDNLCDAYDIGKLELNTIYIKSAYQIKSVKYIKNDILKIHEILM